MFFNRNVFGHYEGVDRALFRALFGLYQGSTRALKVSALQVPSKTRPNVQNRDIPDAQV